MNLSSLAMAAPRQYWVDNLDPWIIHFSGGLGIRWYGIAYALGILLTAYLFSRWSRQGRLPVSLHQVDTLIIYGAAGLLVGGRLGYCLLYDFHEISHHPLQVFAVWNGGMSSHGGILGMVLGICVFAWQRKLNPWFFLDAAVVAGPLAIGLGRIANFINGELWGRPTTVPWAVIFPRSPLVNGMEVPRHPSQLYAAAIEGLLLFLVARWIYRSHPRPGFTTGAVCALYGIGRFIDEFWREPDVGQPVFWGWMSKGQLLTIPMIVAGIALAVWRARRTAQDSPDAWSTERDTKAAH
jgi:phosphatidylglycerol---prolipoprotein diacylglyceryl transferase